MEVPVCVLEELVPALQVPLQQDVAIFCHAGLQVLEKTPGLERLARTLFDEGGASSWVLPRLQQFGFRLKFKGMLPVRVLMFFRAALT